MDVSLDEIWHYSCTPRHRIRDPPKFSLYFDLTRVSSHSSGHSPDCHYSPFVISLRSYKENLFSSEDSIDWALKVLNCFSIPYLDKNKEIWILY